MSSARILPITTAEVDHMTEREHDPWRERRAELALLVSKLEPEQALEIARRVVEDCASGHQVAPALAAMLRGTLEREGTDRAGSASEDAYQAMKEHAPNLGDK
jgi:hypothetical protein